MKTPYILCAAVWYKDIPLKHIFTDTILPINCDRGIVFCGHRHGQCVRSMIAITGIKSVKPDVGEYEQGFLTSDNRFVNRKEAGQIAYASNQISKETDCLFSEDLY